MTDSNFSAQVVVQVTPMQAALVRTWADQLGVAQAVLVREWLDHGLAELAGRDDQVTATRVARKARTLARKLELAAAQRLVRKNDRARAVRRAGLETISSSAE